MAGFAIPILCTFCRNYRPARAHGDGGNIFAVARGGPENLIPTPMWANGRPAVGLRVRSAGGATHPHRLLVLDVEGDRIATLHAYGDPAILAAFGV